MKRSSSDIAELLLNFFSEVNTSRKMPIRKELIARKVPYAIAINEYFLKHDFVNTSYEVLKPIPLVEMPRIISDLKALNHLKENAPATRTYNKSKAIPVLKPSSNGSLNGSIHEMPSNTTFDTPLLVLNPFSNKDLVNELRKRGCTVTCTESITY